VRLARFGKFLLLVLAVSLPAALRSQSTVQAAAPVDETRLATLHGTVHALARPQFDQGAVPDDFPMQRMLVMLQRPPDHEAARQRFLSQVHTPGSAMFHQWLSPEAYGQQFGAKDEDIQTVTAWLQAHGFSVARVTGSRAMIEFSGTAGQVRQALHTEIHQYAASGKSFYANDREISIPEGISSRIRNFAPLNTFPPTSYLASAGKAKLTRGIRGAAPTFTTTANNAPFYALAPEDFATQYDLGPVYAAGTDGSGETIGIIGTTNVNLASVNAYRELFNLPGDHTQIIVDGEDPGDGLAPNVEALLDIELSGAVAPNATVNFYVAGGQPFQNNLALAALRAIEDDQASVLSVSYGACEPLLGEAGNQLWAGLWEQAAAEGQTVLVASGDTGPATCLGIILLGPNGTEETFGLTANGLSSTPWNVSVGGTDFYYSDYSTGGASISSLWNQINDASLGSLKAPLPEQPWSSALGFNIVPYIQVLDGGALIESGPVPSVAGGGASSNCAQETPRTATALPSCIAGYPKPIWQQGTGVPNDGVRDLPDVSLFAANGPNLSAWPICAEAGDCAAGATSFITLVGGTSTSTPAMAGIMALVNQKYGRQGQADYTLYALAQQQPSVFHDITIGTNDILCMIPNPGFPPVPNCTVPYTNPYFPLYSFGLYAAGTGYDLATGLGSVDANELISNWTKVALLPTTTLLQLSPTTVTHGSPISLTASVTPSSSGVVVPTGEIVLETNPVSAMRSNQAIALTEGMASASVTTLPGGSYQVLAQYGGDGVYGASASTPVSVTITPEPSVTALTYKGGGVLSGPVFFGSGVTYEATPTGQNTKSSGLATGSATFTDGNTSATVPLNVNGVATWSPQLLPLGSHSVTVSYSGDASYAPSTGGPLTFTVVPGMPALAVEVLDEPPTVCTAGGTCSLNFVAGSNLVVHVVLRAVNANVPPTGTMTVSLGALTQTVSVVANPYINGSLSTAYATLSNVPAGTYSLSASYSGDSNWNATTYTYPQQLTFVANSAVATTTTNLSLSPSSVNSSGSVTFNVTVTASTDQYGTPFGPVFLLGNGTLFASGFAGPPGGIVTVSPTETATITVPADALPLGQLSVIAVYSGGIGVASSTSAPVQLNVTATDFTFSTGAASLTVKSGQTATVPLLLGGPYGIGVPVSLACAPSSSLFTCSVSPASATVTGSGTATLAITAYVPATTTKLSSMPAENSRRWFAATCSFAFAFGALLIFPRSRRKWKTPTIFLLSAFLLIATACGGGSSSAPPPPNSNPTPPGAYSVVVTATSNGIIHNAQLPVLVSQ
jgi:Pro-kumamolisin, activation domain/Bacterial Ig-like domain (group 3)/Subtilase family